mmetsp:Transcript_40031/g.89805  ORF Transcript_40031/g.89805 Transcript_40031/m.89805 type:complete len:627 (-) Transcript_40031:56-1936(-)
MPALKEGRSRASLFTPLLAASWLLSSCESEELFPDYDCVREGKEVVLPWSNWLGSLSSLSASTGGGGGMLDVSLQYILLLTDETIREAALKECRLGVLMADILQLLLCFAKWGFDGCYGGMEPIVRASLKEVGVQVLLGTRWPIFETLNANIWHETREGMALPRLAGQHGMDCEGLEKPVLDWHHFKSIFKRSDWYQDAVDATYGPELEAAWREAAVECPLGFVQANIVKMMLCAHTESICFHAHANAVENYLAALDLHLIMGSGWPVFQLLAHVSRVTRRHSFQLDFLPEELMEHHSTVRQIEPASDAYSALLKLLTDLRLAADADVRRHGGDRNEGLRLVHASMAFGERFSPYVGRFISRARAVGIEALLIFCLDEQALVECVAVQGYCLSGSPSILNKFTLPLVLLQHDLDVLWLDLDVFLFQSTVPAIIRDAQKADILISGTFAIDCICSGIVFFRATVATSAWLLKLLAWMYQHAYEHDQKAVSAFLRAGERVAFENELHLDDVPSWDYLDPEIEFVSASHVEGAGWAGNPDDIVAFHLLHGDSDATDASRQFASRFSLGSGYLPLLDLFFNQSHAMELYTSAVLPHHAVAELKEALYRSKFETPRPSVRPRCNETVPMQY